VQHHLNLYSGILKLCPRDLPRLFVADYNAETALEKIEVKERAAIQPSTALSIGQIYGFTVGTTVRRDNFPGFLYRRVTRQMFFVTLQIVSLYTARSKYKNINSYMLCRCIYRLIISSDGQR